VSTSDYEFEALLRRALRPVEPPDQLAARLEARLEDITVLAVDVVDSLELRAMRDPRNWVKPAAAVVVGTGAGTALLVLRARRRAQERRREDGGAIEAAERALRDVFSGARTRFVR
jgi:hypothetical protein